MRASGGTLAARRAAMPLLGLLCIAFVEITCNCKHCELDREPGQEALASFFEQHLAPAGR